jgi:hypothetical protein
VNLSGQLVADLKEFVGEALLQERPYPVVAPRNVETASQAVQIALRNQSNVMVLGSGSSFPPDFSILRQNVLALLMVRMVGVERISPFAVRVLAGTPVSTILADVTADRQTIGGLLADSTRPENASALRALWPHIRSIEVLTAGGEVRRIPGCDSGAELRPGATLFAGSRGRLGLIISLEITGPVPISPSLNTGDVRATYAAGHGDAIISQRDVQLTLDSSGLFQW